MGSSRESTEGGALVGTICVESTALPLVVEAPLEGERRAGSIPEVGDSAQVTGPLPVIEGTSRVRARWRHCSAPFRLEAEEKGARCALSGHTLRSTPPRLRVEGGRGSS